jgi:hypothetical protein
VIAEGFHDALTATLWAIGALAGVILLVLPGLVLLAIVNRSDLNWKLRRWLYQHRRT